MKSLPFKLDFLTSCLFLESVLNFPSCFCFFYSGRNILERVAKKGSFYKESQGSFTQEGNEDLVLNIYLTDFL